jgi:hypothetical protein
MPQPSDNHDMNGASRGNARRRRLCVGLVAAAMLLVATPAPALFLTTYAEFVQMSEDEQASVVDAAIYEVIQYFVSTKRDNAKQNCVGRYFSGTYGSDKGGYGDLKVRLEEMHDQYEAGTLGNGEESYVERAVLKLIKDECGI